MNSSSAGWVKKFGHIIEKQQMLVLDDMALYLALESWGFIYGASVALPEFIIPEHKASLDEKAKINLLYGLYITYKIEHPNSHFNGFIEKLLTYYQDLGLAKTSFFTGLISKLSAFDYIEKIIDQRLFPEANLLFKSWGKESINPYLYLDLISFNRFLKNPDTYKTKIKYLEILTLEITQQSLLEFPKTKKRLEQFVKTSSNQASQEILQKEGETTALLLQEKLYFLQLAAINSLSNLEESPAYYSFLWCICDQLDLEQQHAKKAIRTLSAFIVRYKKEIPALKDLNVGAQLYEHLNTLINKLILRNSKRLLKELKGSQELILLLSKSTHKELNETEKKKIQEQLLDIFKSIPSLAIFILPGGAILLPIFIKLIPKLLPSAFDDNRIEDSN